MAEKWQQISLKLDGELAQVLRDMKQGHEESLSEVVLRVLRKTLRPSTSAAPGRSGATRGAPPGRSNPKGAGGRGAFGAGARGKPMPEDAAEYGAPAPGKPFAPRAAPAAGAWNAPRGKRKAAGAGAPRFAPDPRKAGKAARPRQLGGSGEAPRRHFRATPAAPRPTRAKDEQGAAEGGSKRPRKAKGRRSTGR
jgi:hypothetical protein